MAETDKGTDASSKEKEKISVLDDDISRNFLGSWNPSIGNESDDSSMDFKFEPVKGKKKDFDFGKLDMDFSLDGDFDKIKSFKVDMGDLDFSSPPKKPSTKSKETDLDFSPPKTSAKTKGADLDFSSPSKERLEGDSAKSNKGKKDCFGFSFDFNDLDKFDLDAALPTRAKDLNKDDGKKGVKINPADKHEDHTSKIQLADTDAGGVGSLQAKAMQAKEINLKENLVACKGDVDFLPEIDDPKSSILQEQIESKQSTSFSKRENAHQRSPVMKKTCNKSYEESQLHNEPAQNVQDQTHSIAAPVVSEEPSTHHAQRIDKQIDQVACSFNNSYEKPQVQNQPAWSLTDKISAYNVSEQMQTTSADNNLGDADSKMQGINPKVDPSLSSKSEGFPVKNTMLQDDRKGLQMIPEVESDGTDGESSAPESCNVLYPDMDTAMVAEHAKRSPITDSSKLGAHVSEPNLGRTKRSTEISPSRVRFNLKPVTKDKTPASPQVLPRSNLVSLNRKATPSTHSSASISYRHGPQSAQSRDKIDKNSDSFTQDAVGQCFVSKNNAKIVSVQSAREHCNPMVSQMKRNLGDKSGPTDKKPADRGTTFLENEKKKDIKSPREHCNPMVTQMTRNLGVKSVPTDKKPADGGTTFLENEKKKDIKSPSFQVQSSKLPDWNNNLCCEKPNPKIQSLQSVRKLKMDTVVGKLSTLKVSKKLSYLKTSSSPALKDKTVFASNLDSNGMNVTTETAQLNGSGKPQPPTLSFKAQFPASSMKTDQPRKSQPPTPSFKEVSLAPSIKRKISEVSDAAPVISHPSKRLMAIQRSYKNSKDDSAGVAQEEMTHQTNLKVGLKNASEEHPESTFEMPLVMKFADLGVTPVLENDETIEKAEACGKELDQICIMLRKKQEEAKELLVRALVTNNKLLLLSNAMPNLKLCKTQTLASRLLSKELPSKCLDEVMSP